MFRLEALLRATPLTSLLSGVATWLSDQVPIAVYNDAACSRPIINPAFSLFMEQALVDYTVSGISIGVVHHHGSGQASNELGAWGRKTEEAEDDDLTPDALFAMGSVSKAFLAGSMGVLIDDFAAGRNTTPLPGRIGHFDWDTKVADLLPDEWKLMDEWATQKASVRDILSHVSGLPRHDLVYKQGDNISDILGYLPLLRPAYELREQWSYNNIMYVVASQIIAKYSAMPYTDFVSSRIFAPLNMSTTTFRPDETGLHLSQGWSESGRRLPFWASREMVELMAGPGGVVSSASDMVNWVATMMNKGVDPITNATILPLDAWSEATTPIHITPPGSFPLNTIMGYGMGWSRSFFASHDVVFHSGNVPGFSTLVFFCPGDGLGAVLLANGDQKGDALIAIASRILSEAVGLVTEDTTPASTVPEPSIDTSSGVAQAPPSLSLDAYEGTYFHAAYGEILLCAGPPSGNTTNTTSQCSDVLSDFATFEHWGNSDAPSQRSLYAHWPRVGISHLRLMHEAGDDFAVQGTMLFPEGYGLNTTAWETAQPGRPDAKATFVVAEQGGRTEVKRLGMFLQEEVLEYRMRHGYVTPEQLAEVWFDRV